MSSQSWVGVLITAQASGAGPSNSTTAASTLPAQAKFSFPANLLKIGDIWRFASIGQISNVVTTPGTITLDIRAGASTVLLNGGAAQMSTTAHTTLPYWWDVLMTARAVGTTANFMGQGRLTGQMISSTAVADSTTTHGTLMTPNTTPAVGSNMDATAANIIDHFCAFSVSTSATNITCTQFQFEYTT